MTELDYIMNVHRRDARQGEALLDLLIIGVALIAYGIYRLVGVLL